MSVNTPSTDSELMQRVHLNDSKALEALYNRYSPLLYTLIKKIVVDADVAKDVLSDVFVIIWRKIALFDFNLNNVYTWIITITRNKQLTQSGELEILQRWNLIMMNMKIRI